MKTTVERNVRTDNSYNLAYRMAQNDIDWVSIFLSGSVAAKALDIGYSWIKEKQKKKKNASVVISQTAKIYSALQAVPKHQCTRRIVFYAHNGGGPLSVRTNKHASILYEDYHEPFDSLFDDIQNWRIDVQYMNMLHELVKWGVIYYKVVDMEPCKLKDLYESQDVKYVSIHYLGEDGSCIYYCSFATHIDIPQFDVDTRNGINICVNKLIKLMNLKN